MDTGRLAALALLSLAALACGETTGLAVSAGGPVSGVVRGTITECGEPVAGVRVLVHVQQAAAGQVRPVNTEVGPDTTDDRGGYLLDVSPGFGVPGAAEIRLQEASDTTDPQAAVAAFRMLSRRSASLGERLARARPAPRPGTR